MAMRPTRSFSPLAVLTDRRQDRPDTLAIRTTLTVAVPPPCVRLDSCRFCMLSLSKVPVVCCRVPAGSSIPRRLAPGFHYRHETSDFGESRLRLIPRRCYDTSSPSCPSAYIRATTDPTAGKCSRRRHNIPAPYALQIPEHEAQAENCKVQCNRIWDGADNRRFALAARPDDVRTQSARQPRRRMARAR